MFNQDDILNGELLKQFKNSKDFSCFMEELYVRGSEEIDNSQSLAFLIFTA